MNKFVLFVIVTTLLLSSFSPLQAAPDRVLEGLEVLRKGFSDVNDFTADIAQEKQIALLKQKMVSRGVVRFKKPGTFYMELYPPYPSRLLIRDNVLSVMLPDQGVTDRIVLPPEQSLERWFSYLSRPLTGLPEGVEVKAEHRRGVWTLQLFPRSKGGVREVQVTFDGSGRMKRIAIEESNRDRTVITFANLRRNVGLTESDFHLQ